MICCVNCFRDYEIRGIIESIGHRGICPICHSENVWVFDSELHENITDFEEQLESILEIYKIESELDEFFPDEGKAPIEKHLMMDWNIFNVEEEGIRNIVEYIVTTSFMLDDELLWERAGVPELYDEGYLEEHSVMGKYEWRDFKNYLRNENRFHSKYINPDELANVLEDTKVILNKGTRFYRARISGKEKYKNKEMGAPPADKASAGRVNSKGISCLYLASQRHTAVKEIRASVYDYVTIATFELKSDVKVLDLSEIAMKSPFYAADSDSKVNFLINQKHLSEMAFDVSKPLARSDSDLDYLPTQYISDLAKYLGYDGVKYNSTFNKNTYNVALFDEHACSCIYTRRYLVENAEYTLSYREL